MNTISNPTADQIEKALSLARPSNAITGDRYAMTTDGTAFLTKGTLAVGRNLIKAIRYITIYGGVTANVQHILENIDMYPKQNITGNSYIPVHPNEIPELFKNMETTIYEC